MVNRRRCCEARSALAVLESLLTPDQPTLAKHDIPVFSGLAAGIDTAAHRAVVDAGGRTVSVVGTGLRRCYPAENAEPQQEIARTGAVVSQFWPDAGPAKHHFPMRNAVMSGCSVATVVVEAGEHSGTRIQARLALELAASRSDAEHQNRVQVTPARAGWSIAWRL